MLTKSIYVSEVNNLSDARYCSGMGVDYIGICIDESSPNYLPIEKFREINGWVVGVNWVLESDETSFDLILAKCQSYEINRVRVSDMPLAQKLIDEEIEVVLKVTELRESALDSNLLLGYELPFDESIINSIQSNAPKEYSKVYFSGNISIENLELLNSTEAVHGVILLGGDELRPGFKDMDALIDAIEVFED